MKRTLRIAILLSSLWGGAASAQLGLDLREEEEPPAEARSLPAEAPPPVSAEELARRGGLAVPLPSGEDVSLGDRVKAVQRKHFLKRRRFELMPTFAVSLNDPFYTKVGGGLSLTYHFADSFGVSVHFTQYGLLESEDIRIAKRELRSLLLTSKLEWDGGVNMLWTPIYGKLAIFDSIIHYDLYLLAGMGVAWSQTSGAPVQDGAHPALNLGIGQRFALAPWLSLEFALRQLLYADRPQDRSISEIQKVLALHAGVAFWLPSSFEASR